MHVSASNISIGSDRGPFIRLALLGAAIGLCYASVVASIVEVWSTNYLYSYGFVVPVISAYVLWDRLDEIRALRPSPDYLGGIVLTMGGLAILVGGRLGSIVAAEQLSLVIVLAGCILLQFGRRMLSLTLFPLLYLLIGIPVWDTIIGGLQSRSQILSGEIALVMLRTIGIPAFRDGTALALPNVTLDILRECSGVNQLIAVLAMSLPAAYLWLDGPLRRCVLVAFAVVSAYLSNGFRIAMVGFLNYRQILNTDVQGLHVMEGLATSVLGYGLVLGCLSLLSKSAKELPAAENRPHVDAGVQASKQQPWLDAVVVGLVLVAGIYVTTFQPVQVPPREGFGILPQQIDSWTIESSAADVRGYRLTGADDEFTRMYRSVSGERLRVYVAYQRSQQHGKEVGGVTSRALVKSAAPVELVTTSGVVRFNEIVQDAPGLQKGTLFWFDVNGRIVTNWYLAKAYTVWDAVTRRRTNGALILVEWESAAGDEFETARRDVIGFVQSLRPHLAARLAS